MENWGYGGIGRRARPPQNLVPSGVPVRLRISLPKKMRTKKANLKSLDLITLNLLRFGKNLSSTQMSFFRQRRRAI